MVVIGISARPRLSLNMVEYIPLNMRLLQLQ